MRRMLALISATLLVALLAACQGEVRQPAKSESEGGTFVYSFNLDVVTEWDPALSYSNEIIAMENIYESLTFYNADTGTVEPRLATDWTSAAGGKKWTFTLRDGATFHTGRPVDSTAVKESLERTMKLQGGAAYIWEPVKAISAPDPQTVVFDLKYPTSLDLVASSVFAAYIYDVNAAPESTDLGKWFNDGNDAGSGPYTVDKWTPGAEFELTLAAYDDYWGGWQDGQFRAIDFRVTPELTTAWQLLETGEVSFVGRLTPQLFEQATQTDGIATTQTGSFQNLLALYNTRSGPLSDVRVRRAVQLATNTEDLVAALKGAAVTPKGLIPEGLLGFGDVSVTPDLTEAARLLKEAGYSTDNPLKLSLTYAQGDDDQRLYTTLLGSQLKELGVELNATPMQWNAQWSKAKSGNKANRQDIFVMYWYPDYADPYSWFINVFRSAEPPFFNLSYLADQEVDQQIDGLPALTATDRAAAEQTYQKLQQQLIVDQAAVSPLLVQNYQRAFSDSIGGYVDNAAYPNVVFVYDLTQQ